MKAAGIAAGLAALSLAWPAVAFGGDGAAVLTDGFDGSDFAKSGGLYYKENAEQAAGTFTFQPDVKLSGEGALKLTIRSLCPPDDEGCSERAEIWERTKLRAPFDTGTWYGFAVKFDDTIPTDDHRYLIAQWKREIGPEAVGDFSPFLAFRMKNGKLFVTVETNYYPPMAGYEKPEDGPVSCPSGGVPVWLRPDTNQLRILVAHDDQWKPDDAALFSSCTDAVTVIDHGNPLPEPNSGWIDFAVYSKPGPEGDGHIEIYANGKPVVTVKGHIGHNDKGLGENQYFKFGPYRDGHTGEWTLYYDDFRRSPHCADVLKGAACPFS
ncbi:MAG: polysaccharide lyase [Rhizobiaceae bacterium]|nr:polysaccharide lyase [Rhizobiaceae bacterium]